MHKRTPRHMLYIIICDILRIYGTLVLKSIKICSSVEYLHHRHLANIGLFSWIIHLIVLLQDIIHCIMCIRSVH